MAMRRKLVDLAGSGKLVRLFIRPEADDPFLAAVVKVEGDSVEIEAFDSSTLEKWGEVVVMVSDVYRIDLYSRKVAELVMEMSLQGVIPQAPDGGEGEPHAPIA